MKPCAKQDSICSSVQTLASCVSSSMRCTQISTCKVLSMRDSHHLLSGLCVAALPSVLHPFGEFGALSGLDGSGCCQVAHLHAASGVSSCSAALMRTLSLLVSTKREAASHLQSVSLLCERRMFHMQPPVAQGCKRHPTQTLRSLYACTCPAQVLQICFMFTFMSILVACSPCPFMSDRQEGQYGQCHTASSSKVA